MKKVSLDSQIVNGSIRLGRGNIISSKDIAENPGDYPIYSSSAKGAGEFGCYDHYMFDEELITWSIDGGGRFFFRPKHKFSITNVSGYVKSNDEIWDRKFLYYSLDFQHGRLAFDYQTKAHPSVIRHLYSLTEFPRAEQTKISGLLAILDYAIEQTEALIVKQQRIKTGLMQDLLTKGIDEHGNIRNEATHAFKDSPLGLIPVEWQVKQLGVLAKQVTSGSRGWAGYYSHEGAIFLRIGNLTREHINLRLEDLVHVQVANSSEGKRTSVQEGDLLVSITADLGIIAVIPKKLGEAYVNQHIALVRLDEEVTYPRFVGHLLSGNHGQFQIEKLNESGAKAGLNLPTVEKLFVAIPELSEQERIAEIIDCTDKQIDKEKVQLKKLAHIKAGLMHDLLTGKRRVIPLLEQIVSK